MSVKKYLILPYYLFQMPDIRPGSVFHTPLRKYLWKMNLFIVFKKSGEIEIPNMSLSDS